MEDLPGRLVAGSLRSRLRSLPQGVSGGALFFAVAVVAYTVAGAVWGALYPTTEVRVSDDLSVDIVPGTEGAGFVAYAWFIAVTFVLGIALSRWSFRSMKRSVGQMFWVFLCVLFGAWWFVFTGGYVVSLMPSGDSSVEPGAVLEVADQVYPWPGVLVAPTFAVLAYWIGAVISDPEWFEGRS